jgi:sigma-E processing peptidase SpoIIGA
MVLGAVAESFFFCGIFLLPGMNGWIKTIILAVVSPALPVFVFRLYSLNCLVRALFFYYGTACLLGGAFYALLGMFGKVTEIHTGMTACGLLFLGVLVLVIWRWESGNKEKIVTSVELLEGNVRVVTTALIDSGNTLYDPISSRPVCVVERSVLKERIPLMQPEKFRIVPYHTLGSRGIMQVIQIDEMVIRRDGQEIKVKKPLLGLYDGEVTEEGDYRMILHTGYLKKGDKLLRGSGKEEKRK